MKWPALVRALWRIRYWLYFRDVTAPLRTGRGTRENPLTMEDLGPWFTYWRRVYPPVTEEERQHLMAEAVRQATEEEEARGAVG